MSKLTSSMREIAMIGGIFRRVLLSRLFLAPDGEPSLTESCLRRGADQSD